MDFSAAKFFMLNSNFGVLRSGIENAALYRAMLFKKYLGILPIIVTATFNPRLNLQRRKLVDTGLIDSDIKIINLYDALQEMPSDLVMQKNEMQKANANWRYQSINNSKNYRLFDRNSKLYVEPDEEGRVMFSTLFVNTVKTRRDVYNINGFLSKAQFFSPSDGQLAVEIYYRMDGTTCIYKYFEFKNDKSLLTTIHLTDRSGNIEYVFESEADLITHWIKSLLDSSNSNFLIVDREAVYYNSLLKIKQENVYKICMIHNKHFNKALGKYNSDTYKTICEDFSKSDQDPSKPDAIVVLTNRQKDDMNQQFGMQDHLFSIPNCTGKIIHRVDYNNRAPYQAICLARYTPEKQHSSLIRVFDQVVKEYPMARLDLYGFGDESIEMIKRIKALHLEENIFVNGFADNVERIYQSAVLAVLTSKLEGFPLFLLESISNGCICISYNIDYGPSDMIEDGINGYLIDYNNEDDMARKICSLFADHKKMQDMSEASYKKAGEFQADVVAEKWRNLLNVIIERRASKQSTMQI